MQCGVSTIDFAGEGGLNTGVCRNFNPLNYYPNILDELETKQYDLRSDEE